MGVAYGTYEGEKKGVQGRKGFWWGNLKKREHLEELGSRWEDNIKIDLKEIG
jgi:hypothetical protein